jgi:hypothetical protein
VLPFVVAYLHSFLRFNSGPREGIQLFSKGEIVGDLAIAKHETIRKTSANPVSRVLQADPNMEIHNDFVPIRQKLLGSQVPSAQVPRPLVMCSWTSAIPR